MSGEGVKVEGARQLRKTMKAAGVELTELKETHKKAAAIALTGIEPLVPVGNGARNGKNYRRTSLKDSLRPAGTNTAAIVRAGKKTAPHAGSVQWGRKRWPSLVSTPNYPGFVKPRLFMTEGAKKTEPKWVAAYEAATDKILNTITGA